MFWTMISGVGMSTSPSTSIINALWSVKFKKLQSLRLSSGRYQHQLVRQIRRGYDGSGEDGAKFRWTIPAALMYCITIYTTIGTSYYSFYTRILYWLCSISISFLRSLKLDTVSSIVYCARIPTPCIYIHTGVEFVSPMKRGGFKQETLLLFPFQNEFSDFFYYCNFFTTLIGLIYSRLFLFLQECAWFLFARVVLDIVLDNGA